MTSIQESIPLADKTWFKTGGAARFYSEPTTAAEFQAALQFATIHELPLFILGEGANVLVSDEGFDGLVIRPRIMDCTHTEDGEYAFAHVGAGLSFKELIDYCLEHQLVGLEEFSGIPGTVGGSVFINIHYFEFFLSTFLEQATVIDRATGIPLTVDHPWFNFSYNYSTLHENNHYLAGATFKLKKVSPLEAAYAKGRRDEIVRQRSRRYPTERTCGSFFRNFHPHEVTPSKHASKITHVAYYFDALGFKGHLAHGSAKVSHKHANMIVSSAQSTSQDIISLAATMQALVYDRFGIIPQPECRFVGFKKHPLL